MKPRILLAESGELQEDLENVVFALRPGEFARPTYINDVLYIFKLLRIIPAKQLSLEQAREKAYAAIYDQRMKQLMARWLSELKKKSYIKVFQD